MADIFLSYSRDDLNTARRFAEAFEREGFSVWWDQTLNPGEAFDEVTEKALNEARAVVVLWSKKSVASRWVRAEATQANDSKTLVPVMIEPCKRPIMFELTHTADLSSWKGNSDDPAWQSYLAGVRRIVGKGMAGATSQSTVQSVGNRKNRIDPAVVAIVLGALLIAGAAFWASSRRGDEHATSLVPVVSLPTAAKEVTLAVLPFADMSQAHDQEDYSDGLTEEIMNQLAQIKKMRVTGRTSSFSFKGKNEDLRVIAEKLGVAHLLEGSIRKEGAQLRITAQLIDGKDGAQLWSQTYNRKPEDVFAVQEGIAKDVARALSIKLDVGDMPRAEGGTTDIEAYEKYLQAVAILRQAYLSERIFQAVQLLQEAVKQDPAFVRAWARLAEALHNAPLWKPESSEALARSAANAEARVLALAPDGQIAQFIRLEQSMAQHRWSEAAIAAEGEIGSYRAEFEFRQEFLSGVGRIEELINGMEAVREQDPLNLTASTNLQQFLDAAGRPAEAQAEYERSRDLAGNHNQADFFAMLRLMARKDADRATVKAKFRTVLKAAPLAIDPNLTDKIDDKEAVRAELQKAFENPANRVPLRMGIIATYAGAFGYRDLAIAALRQDVIDLHGSVTNIWLAGGSDVRADPLFKEVLRNLGLVDYYRASGNWGDFCKPVGKDDFECH
jgi:TolB-like protein/tetratricopeptide (TPR) repeat protein